jgi:hypothetical protein
MRSKAIEARRVAWTAVAISIALSSLVTACKKAPSGPGETTCTLQNAVTLPVNLSPQELDNWCWAASGQMVMVYLGQAVTQCAEANEYFGHNPPDCCPSTTAGTGCDTGGWPTFSKHNIAFLETPEGVALTLDQLKLQIGCRHMPVAFSWKWDGGGGHMMVAVGYNTLSVAPLVEVDDPWAPTVGSHRFITYDEYVAAANDHSHWSDFYNFSK